MPRAWYFDADGDGYGAPASAEMACDAPLGGIADGSDCDDTNWDVHPNGFEICNGLDDDCDGLVDNDDDVVGDSFVFVDADGDGFGSGAGLQRCLEAGYSETGDDCDDTDPLLVPVDVDGDGSSTCEGDCDGLDPWLTTDDTDGDGLSTCEGDCDDEDSDATTGCLLDIRGKLAFHGDPMFADRIGDAIVLDLDGDGVLDIVALAFVQSLTEVLVFYGPFDSDRDFASADARIPSDDPYVYVGFDLVAMGDLDDDGFDDAAFSVTNRMGNGGARLLYGGADRRAGTIDHTELPGWWVQGSTPSWADRLVPDRIGDLDGDGWTDYALGYDVFAGPGFASGRTWVVYGDGTRRTGYGPVASPTTWTGVEGAQLGTAAATCDLDGDGERDLLIGAPGLDDGLVPSAGGVFAVYGNGQRASDESIETDADALLRGSNVNGFFGETIYGDFDLDGDGYDDFAVTEWTDYSTNKLRIFRGGATRFAGTASSDRSVWLTIEGRRDESDRIGYAMVATDIDGDGQTDLAVGAIGGYGSDSGHVYVYFGPFAGGVLGTSDADVVLSSGPIDYATGQNGQFGTSLSAGDFDGNGRPDLWVGSVQDAGSMRIFLDGQLSAAASRQ